MLRNFLLLLTLVCSAQCEVNNIPRYNPTERIIDCTDGKAITDICDVVLVVEMLTTMTHFNISSEYREPRSYRVAFNSMGNLVQLENPIDLSNLPPAIQADGQYRTIIAINAQMPGPMIIAHENQTLNITVFNELKNAEGISIHWHGIHQRGTPEADGVAYITQNPILPQHRFTYTFKASPAGTHWYHGHTGEQRSDGLYGAFIVKDTLPGNVYDHDYPDQHTLILMDWQREAAIDTFSKHQSEVGFYRETPISDPPYIRYDKYALTFGPDYIGTSPIPFWSGIINDKGRFYDEFGRPNIVNPNCGNLNCFNVSQNGRYRFRLIGAQAFFSYRFSIEGHSLTVVASDGSPINSIEDVDYVIVHPGERYDVVVHANNEEIRNYWIWAETLEDEVNSNMQVFHNPISKHRAEAILHYTEYNAIDISEINETKTCTPSSKCKAVNCPFTQYGTVMDCINVEQFESPPSTSIPQSIHSPNVTLFYSIGFDQTGNFIDGVNFRLPANPPLTEYAAFKNSNDMCPNRGCDHDIQPQCACTHVMDISDQATGSVVEVVITNRNADIGNPVGSLHPMHLHGHHFYVVDVGYGDYDENGIYAAASDDIECIVRSNDQACPKYFTTVEEENGELKQEIKWKNETNPVRFNTQNKRLVRKDTLTAPYGGYIVVRFIVDNPGWWSFHCHMQIDQSTGMAAVIKELPNELSSPNDNMCIPTESSSYNIRGFPLLMIGIISILSVLLL